jgi:hypothetical protein
LSGLSAADSSNIERAIVAFRRIWEQCWSIRRKKCAVFDHAFGLSGL